MGEGRFHGDRRGGRVSRCSWSRDGLVVLQAAADSEVAVTSSGSWWLGRAVCTNSPTRRSAGARCGAQTWGGWIRLLRVPRFPTEAGSSDMISQAILIRGRPGPRTEQGGAHMDARALHGDRNGGRGRGCHTPSGGKACRVPLLSLHPAGFSVWIRSLRSSRPSSGAIDFAGDARPAGPWPWLPAGSVRGFRGRPPPPPREGDPSFPGCGRGLEPRGPLTRRPRPRGASSPRSPQAEAAQQLEAPAPHLLFTSSLIMIKRRSLAHFPVIYSFFFFLLPLLVKKSHHPSKGNEKCNKNHNLMKH